MQPSSIAFAAGSGFASTLARPLDPYPRASPRYSLCSRIFHRGIIESCRTPPDSKGGVDDRLCAFILRSTSKITIPSVDRRQISPHISSRSQNNLYEQELSKFDSWILGSDLDQCFNKKQLPESLQHLLGNLDGRFTNNLTETNPAFALTVRRSAP